jgi:hypothetical protein
MSQRQSSPGSGSSPTNWKAAKQACFTRDEGMCRRCSCPAADCHHRKPKGMGGTSDTERAFGLAGLISVCRECHSWIHAHPEISYEEGWLVHSWQDPADVPLKDPGKERYEF